MKKFNILQKFMLVFSLTMFVYSCSTDNTTSETTSNSTLKETSILERSSNFTFSQENIEYIGVMHNKHLEDAYKNFDYNSTTPIADLKSNLMAIDIPELTIEEKQDIINFVFENQIEGGKYSLTDLDYLKQNLESQTAKDIVDSAYSSLNNLQYQSDFSNALKSLKTNASNNLTKSDLNSVLAYLEVLEQSSYFWKSTQFGGSGKGNTIILNMQVSSNRVSPCTKAVVAADGTGAATAVLSAGIGGWIAGTLNPGAMAAAVAIAAAAASITASQTHYACQD